MSSGSWKIQGDVMSDSESVTDNVMRWVVELLLQIHNSERDAEEIDRVASPSQPSARVKIKRQSEVIQQH